jgi:hypothetical protein
MSKTTQIYCNAIFGALGGLLAWFILGFLPRGDVDLLPILAKLVPFGAGSGLFLGLLIGQVEGTLIDKNLRKALIGAGKGALAGLISGLFGFVIAQLIFTIVGGGIVGRVLGWLFFGLAVGFSQGLVNRSFRKISYGSIGGLLGGLCGGLLYEGITQLARSNEAIYPAAGGLGMLAVGASIGALFAFVLRIGRAQLICVRGRREGTTYVMEENRLIFGRDDSTESGRYYLPDSGLAATHTIVEKQHNHYFLRQGSVTAQVHVVRSNLEPVAVKQNPYPLQNNDLILLGDTVQLRFIFSTK